MSSTDVNRRIARFALDRLGYGPRPESIDEVLDRGVERWARDQLDPGADRELETRLRALPALAETILQTFTRANTNSALLNEALFQFRSAHFVRAVHSRNQLQEVLADFWFNHFTVYINDGPGHYGIIRYEQDSIRPHVLGRFRDILGAVANSWSMMGYLDNYISTNRRINEIYARELMELHTMGVEGGYTQGDVEEVARAFTGWTIDARPGTFVYRADTHDQGAKTVLGQRLPPNQGKKDGEDVLDLLARHPSTARFIATKLARRCVADDPPPAVVTRAADTFTQTSGDIAQVMESIFSTREFWNEAFGPRKIKTPHEYVVSGVRAVGGEITSSRAVLDGRGPSSLVVMGMPTYESLDPTGWSDRGTDWLPNPGSHLARMNFALGLVSQTQEGLAVDIRPLIGKADPSDARAVTEEVDRRIFGGTLSPETRAACTRATSSGSLSAAFKVVGVALASPDFQVK
jgi:uncharacterized protein (DUF1800 family)